MLREGCYLYLSVRLLLGFLDGGRLLLVWPGCVSFSKGVWLWSARTIPSPYHAIITFLLFTSFCGFSIGHHHWLAIYDSQYPDYVGMSSSNGEEITRKGVVVGQQLSLLKEGRNVRELCSILTVW